MATTTPASRRTLGRLAVLAVVGLSLGAAVANALPAGSVEAQMMALVGVACVVPFSVYAFRFLGDAITRKSGRRT